MIGAGKRSILIVEDDDDLRVTLKDMMSSLDLDIFTACNGLDALEFLDHTKVTAILSDISMPKMNGIEFLGELKHRSISVPVVMITGFADKDVIVSALRLGAVDFLDKPFYPEDVVSVMQRVIEIGVRQNTLDDLYQKLIDGCPDKSVSSRIDTSKRVASLIQLTNDAKKTAK